MCRQKNYDSSTKWKSQFRIFAEYIQITGDVYWSAPSTLIKKEEKLMDWAELYNMLEIALFYQMASHLFTILKLFVHMLDVWAKYNSK